jgi:transcriptional regulator with PAS, ATPase and Fis domain
LICGPSGTGKELVARAIGWSRYVPFDGRRKCYEGSFVGRFYPISLAALSSSVIESELFGHSRGSFTGAAGDRAGFFEVAGAHGTVFLDEIGEVSLDIQVKLLRVLQTRMFQRMGETSSRDFEGKIVAATNADLVTMMRDGRFRDDLFYRLCADLVETPSLAEQISDDPEALSNLLGFISNRVAGPDLGPELAHDVNQWVLKELPPNYGWPGNIRELEQCVRNVLIRNRYTPVRSQVRGGTGLPEAVKSREVQLNELVQWYCTEVYAESKGYEDAAARLGIDPRTLKSKIDWERLEKLQGD